MDKKNLNLLSDRLGITFDGGNVVLFNAQSYNPKRITVITSDEMQKLLALYTDGCCPVCVKEIPLGDVICDECLEQAKAALGRN